MKERGTILRNMAQVNLEKDGFDEESLSTEDLDALKAALVYLLMENTVINLEEVYSLVFYDGEKITWN